MMKTGILIFSFIWTFHNRQIGVIAKTQSVTIETAA